MGRSMAWILAACLLSGAGCGPSPETRRLEAEGFVPVEVGSVVRPARVLPTGGDGAHFEAAVEGVGRGRMEAYLALRGEERADATARIALAAEGGLLEDLRAAPGSCEVRWDGDDVDWQRCEIALPRDFARLRLRVEYQGPEDAELLLSRPVFESAARRTELPPVFVVLIDTTRADAFHSFDPRTPVGARLDRLARDGLVFTRARSTSGWTRTAVASLFTGHSPFTHRVLDRQDVLAPGSETLARALQRAGYVTSAWSTNPNILERWGFAQGFDRFEDVRSVGWAIAKADGSRVIEKVEQAIARDGTAGRFFYIHLMDPHQPYRPAQQSLDELDALTSARYELPGKALRPSRTNVIRARYRDYQGEVHETDRYLGGLLDLLEQRGEYGDALIAVLSDHGEEFLDHLGTGHGETLYEEMLRVPFWLKLPGGARAGERVERDVGLSDVMPTLLSALGLPRPDGGEGRDLLAPEPDAVSPEPHFARLKLERVDVGAVVQGRWKLILDFARRSEALYDLENDPGEHHDLSGEHPERVAELRDLFEERHPGGSWGWYLRACGGAEDEVVALTIEPEADGAVIRTRRLEPGDRMDETDGTARLRLWLTPRHFPVERPASMGELVPDVDDILIEAADGGAPPFFSLRSERPISYRFGAEGALERGRQIETRSRRDEATVGGDVSLRCPEQGEAHLQIWYVEPPARETREIDAELGERLRALGYGE